MKKICKILVPAVTLKVPVVRSGKKPRKTENSQLRTTLNPSKKSAYNDFTFALLIIFYLIFFSVYLIFFHNSEKDSTNENSRNIIVNKKKRLRTTF